MNENERTKLTKITSHLTAHYFFNWIAEHPEVDDIQGKTISRMTGGSPSNYGRDIFDIETIWNNRRELNDWIERVLDEVDFMAVHYSEAKRRERAQRREEVRAIYAYRGIYID